MGNNMYVNNSSSSDGESKYDSLHTGSPNQLLLRGEDNIWLADDNASTDAASPTNTTIIIPGKNPVPFEEYYTNDENIWTVDQSRYILAACIGTVDASSFAESPYKDLKKPMLPTQIMLRQEILWRSPGHKIRKMKNNELLEVLASEELKIDNEVDKEYITDREKEYRLLLITKEDEAEKAIEDSRIPNITTTDWLRYLEVMLSDEVKVLYRSSQDWLSRGNLDARNSVVCLFDFYDKVVEVFNNPEFIPETLKLPDLHEDFTGVIKR